MLIRITNPAGLEILDVAQRFGGREALDQVILEGVGPANESP